MIVSQKGRDAKENLEYSAKKDEKITDLPLVVLVNSGSASASEIVSGALQDLKRAVIIGEETFGKGSVQVILPLNEKEALKMTIARYYLPSGRTIQNKGVTPDLEVFYGKVPNDDKAFNIKETDLKQHLENELQKIDDNKTENNKTINLDHNKTDTKEKDKEKIITKKDLYDDMQLKTAVDTIKVLNLTKDGK